MPLRIPWEGGLVAGAAAKVMNFDRLGKRNTPWHFGEDESRLTGVPKKSLSKNRSGCQKTCFWTNICLFFDTTPFICL